MPAAPPGRTPDGSEVGLHRLSVLDVDSLALGGLDPAVVRRLMAAETSYRRIAVRAALELLREQPATPGPLAPVDEAWEILVAAERRDPAAVRTVLDRPFTGAWAARLLRRLRDPTPAAAPLWVEVGYLHTLAVAATVRAGCVSTLAVPARRGVVHLPSLGHAHLAGLEPWDTATVVSTRTRVRIVGPHGDVAVPVPDHPTTPGVPGSPGDARGPDPRPEPDDSRDPDDALGPDRSAGAGPDPPGEPDPTRGWQPTRTVAPGVVVEDADPYRVASGAAGPVRLPAAAVARWQGQLSAARQVLRAGHPRTAAAVETAITAIVPFPAAARFRSFSATSGDAIGSIEMSVPHDAVDGAATLAHELRHTLLGALSHLGALVDPAAPPELLRAPWRDDPRPARGVLEGLYAYFGVTDFWRTRRRRSSAGEAMLAHFEFALWRRAVGETAVELLRTGPLTALGRRFVTGIATTVHGWLAEPVPAHARHLADLAAADTHALWNSHHLGVPIPVARRLAAAWTSGGRIGLEPAATASRLAPDPAARRLDTRACLARLWLSDRDALRRVERDDPGRVYRGASAADCALVRGDHASARELYLAHLRRPGENRRALVGLALAGTGDPAAQRVLRMRPELVLAVAREVTRQGGPVSFPELAAWLVPLVPAPSPPTDGTGTDGRTGMGGTSMGGGAGPGDGPRRASPTAPHVPAPR
ncbi:HEXXH motif domain [Frankia sp. AiPs1]|uniref:HEXXH motif domain-containing protein n=1 Tax=Frankia sp. AiPa1 TaxID=573492 RepID=UPI00202B1C1B|nr:HEXXH motif domain-containing protein [Frankia sp. AiPa1]MCL9761640.1 HEXXH motif domain-containing protein [Frankia sp. AiPa1]